MTFYLSTHTAATYFAKITNLGISYPRSGPDSHVAHFDSPSFPALAKLTYYFLMLTAANVNAQLVFPLKIEAQFYSFERKKGCGSLLLTGSLTVLFSWQVPQDVRPVSCNRIPSTSASIPALVPVSWGETLLYLFYMSMSSPS